MNASVVEFLYCGNGKELSRKVIGILHQEEKEWFAIRSEDGRIHKFQFSRLMGPMKSIN